MSNGNGSNGNGARRRLVGRFQGCSRNNCQINGGVLRPGEARKGDDNPCHVVDCDKKSVALRYIEDYPSGMTMEEFQGQQLKGFVRQATRRRVAEAQA